MSNKLADRTDNIASTVRLTRVEFQEDNMAAPKQSPAPASPHAEPFTIADIHEAESGRRRMPESLRKNLIRMQGGKLYLPAAFRIVWFRDECPEWGVETALIEGGQEAGFATVQARIYNNEGRLIASGLKTETRQDFPAGWVEKAETGAIARALALAGFGTQFAPELDDDSEHPSDSPQRVRSQSKNSAKSSDAPRRTATEVWEGPGQCQYCHAPIGKRHGKPCVA